MLTTRLQSSACTSRCAASDGPKFYGGRVSRALCDTLLWVVTFAAFSAVYTLKLHWFGVFCRKAHNTRKVCCTPIHGKHVRREHDTTCTRVPQPDTRCSSVLGVFVSGVFVLRQNCTKPVWFQAWVWENAANATSRAETQKREQLLISALLSLPNNFSETNVQKHIIWT